MSLDPLHFVGGPHGLAPVEQNLAHVQAMWVVVGRVYPRQENDSATVSVEVTIPGQPGWSGEWRAWTWFYDTAWWDARRGVATRGTHSKVRFTRAQRAQIQAAVVAALAEGA
jgi:hypothetical protein